MKFVSFDCESHLIKPGLMAPKMVCMSFAFRDDRGVAVDVVDRETALRFMSDKLLYNDDVALIGHNVWYDLGLFVATDPDFLWGVFDKLEKGLIYDTMIRQQLIDIAEGQLKFHFDEDGEIVRSSYHLADLSYRLNKRFVKKGSDTWRLRYALLDGLPIDGWPEDAKQYAIDDAEITLEVFEAQQRIIESVTWTKAHPITGKKHLMNSVEQHRAAWVLHLMGMWGVRTDGEAVTKLKAFLEEQYAEFMVKLRPSGLFNIAPERVIRVGKRKGEVVPEKVSKNMQAIYERVAKCFFARGEDVPLTETKRVATDRMTLKATKDPQLAQLAAAGFTQKLLTTYVPTLERGTRVPINPRWNPLVETGRISCSGPNMTNPPRAGGVRECFIPRPGQVFVFCDFDTIELKALAQACLDILGRSSMAEALRRGEDLHLSVAAQLLNISVTEAKNRYQAGDSEVKEARQQAKVANFGFPGGMGAEAFREYAAGVEVFMSLEQAETLRATWFATWTEMADYFAFIDGLTNRSDQLTQLRSGRVRGGASFCAAANGFFQGLAADGAKEALWRVSCECYVPSASPLYGCRPVLFIHDEIGLEVPYADPVRASAAADRLQKVMIEAMSAWIPDVPITCKPVMCKRWYKGAEAIRVNGLLVPSRPLKVEDKTRWIPDIPEEATTIPSLLKIDPALEALLRPSA